MNNSITNYIDQTLKKNKNKVAYKDSMSSVTFEEVYKKSGSIATALIKKGFFEKPILIMSKRNVITPIGHIGIARSGNYYIPMDPGNPPFRLNQIINIINTDVLIVEQENLSTVDLLNFHGEILILENLIQENYDADLVMVRENSIVNTMPLYVIFTSGSEGVPKGVTTSHQSLQCYIDDIVDVLNVTNEDVLANQSPMDYIAAVRDIFIPLKTGATTYIVPSNEFAIPDALLNTLNSNNITTLCWSAAGLELCVKTGLFECGIPQHINKVLFSGSILSGKALVKWQNAFPEALFINQYGPTEATASCTYYVVNEKANDNTILPIGNPFKNYKIILLGEQGCEVEYGHVGEICVSGPAVTLGYYGNPSATSKSYIQNPLNSFYRETIYKTGDLGRYNEKGVLEFCGRKDRQIKHLGHRIELEEIETIGRSMPGIDECIAMYDHNKSTLIIVYTGSTTNKEIILYFRNNYPAYMIPRKAIKLESFPQLPNGKINIKRLEQEILK